MALGKLGLVCSQDEADVRKLWSVPAKGLVYQDLYISATIQIQQLVLVQFAYKDAAWQLAQHSSRTASRSAGPEAAGRVIT